MISLSKPLYAYNIITASSESKVNNLNLNNANHLTEYDGKDTGMPTYELIFLLNFNYLSLQNTIVFSTLYNIRNVLKALK